MILSRKSHDLIVAELRNQITDLKAERDFYRKEWTKSRGKAFPSPSTQVEPPLPLFERPSVEQSAPTPIDADWTADDRDLFQDWARKFPGTGINPEEEWERQYGDKPPLLVLTV